MRSLLGGLVDAIRPRNATTEQANTPVPYTSRNTLYGAGTVLGGDRTTAHQLSLMGQVGTLFGVVHRTTTATAAVNWHLYKKAASGRPEDRTEVTSHAALDLINKPNPFMHRQRLMESVQQHIELAGKGFLVLYLRGGLPLEMWYARPDRILPIPHPTRYLSGWVYLGPDGDKIPLGLNEVIPLTMPDPLDPYGGLSPVHALSDDLDTTRYSSQYSKLFFINGAEPGGIVEAPDALDDDEFKIFQLRWDEQHRGVSRAHRVALLEGGMHWVDRNTTQKDMQFVELRTSTRDTVLEAWTMPRGEMGITEDVNLANAKAGKTVFEERLTVPRLERWKAGFNWHLLPMYGATSRNMEFDYENPVPEDEDSERAELLARAQAAAAYASAGWPLAAIAEALDLPEALQNVEEPAPPPPPVIAPPPDPNADPNAPPPPIPAQARRLDRPRAELPPPAGPDQVDHTETQATWQRLVEQLMVAYGPITAAQRAQLLTQIQAAVDAGDLTALTDLTVDTGEAADLLADYLDRMAVEAAHKVVREAMSQGVDGVEPHTPKRSVLADLAKVTTALAGSALALAAGREAMRVQSADTTGLQVAEQVGHYLDTLTPPKAELGGAMTGAQNQARIETFRKAPEAALYADERMDSNTCGPCKEINGRWIGNTVDGVAMAEVERLYPQGGYVDCLGRSRCRGTITGIWRSQQAGGQ